MTEYTKKVFSDPRVLREKLAIYLQTPDKVELYARYAETMFARGESEKLKYAPSWSWSAFFFNFWFFLYRACYFETFVFLFAPLAVYFGIIQRLVKPSALIATNFDIFIGGFFWIISWVPVVLILSFGILAAIFAKFIVVRRFHKILAMEDDGMLKFWSGYHTWTIWLAVATIFLLSNTYDLLDFFIPLMMIWCLCWVIIWFVRCMYYQPVGSNEDRYKQKWGAILVLALSISAFIASALLLDIFKVFSPSKKEFKFEISKPKDAKRTHRESIVVLRQPSQAGKVKTGSQNSRLREIIAKADEAYRKKDKVAMSILYGEACKLNDPRSCLILANILSEEHNGLPDMKYYHKALRLHKQARLGGGVKRYEFGEQYDQNEWLYINELERQEANKVYKKYIEFNKKDCEAGNMRACAELGKIYSQVVGHTDEAKAVKYNILACEGGFSANCEFAGDLLSNTRSRLADGAKAAFFYDKACAQKDAWSCKKLADLYSGNNGLLKRDEDKMREYRKKSCGLQHGDCY